MVLHRGLWAVHLDRVAFGGAQAVCWLGTLVIGAAWVGR